MSTAFFVLDSVTSSLFTKVRSSSAKLAIIVSFDISVNGGAGLVRRFLKATAHIEDSKVRASEINRLMEAHYRGIVARNPSQSVFLKGWLNRAAKQREMIAKY